MIQINRIIKRCFDVVFSAVAILILSVPMLIVALAVFLTDYGPILYPASRVGMGGRIIKVYKFRTMIVDADKFGPRVTAANDPRITRIGRILRNTKLDELPQLFNVLLGDMSLVGPRPENQHYVNMYTPEQYYVILSVRPGITGAASVVYRDEEKILAGPDSEEKYIKEVMPAKLAIDMAYIQKASFIEDLKIILATIRVL